jgi:uncharacterized membrane protein
MRKQILAFGLLWFIFLAPVSLAADYQVLVEISPQTISVNPCDIANFDLEVINLGEIEDVFSITIQGLPEEWYSLSEDSLTLDSGESRQVYLFVTPYCYGEIGSYEGEVLVTGQSNSSDVFTLNVVADRAIDVSMPNSAKVCLQDDSTITVTIENNGNFTEELDVEILGNATDIAELSEESLTLGPEESGDVVIILSPTELGIFTLDLEVESQTSYVKSSASSIIEVDECYGVDVSYPEQIEVCVNEPVQIEITLENTGLKEDSYRVEIEDLNYTETINIDPQDSKIVEVMLLGERTGSFDVEFTIESDFVREEGMINLDVVGCYGVDLVVEEDEFDIELGRGKLIEVEVKNLGTKEDNFEIVSNVDWISIKPSSIDLEGGESQIVYVYYSPEFGMKGEFNASLTVSSQNSEDTEQLKITVLEAEVEETTTTTMPSGIDIPTGDITGIFNRIWGSRILRSLLIAIIVVLIVIIAIYLVIMR